MSDTLRLFIIEDDDDIALLVRKSLERAGHHVTRCRTAADALTVLGNQSFDLVLLDQRLPDLPGIDLLRTLGREGIAVPVLMVTAYGDEQLATQVLRAGALDYLVKDNALTFLSELPKRVQESVFRHRLQLMNRLLIESLESAGDGILISNLQATVLHTNHALEMMTGYGRAELLGQVPSFLFRPGTWDGLREGLSHTFRTRHSWQREYPLLRKDGTALDVSLAISPIVDSQGQVMHFVAILRDVSERKQLERQLLQAQKMQSIGTLAGGVAHEFNNLLAGINGYAALGLREPGVTGTLREFLQNIVGLSERAASLTRQLLTFARKPALTRRPLPPAELFQSTRDLVTRTLHQEVLLDLQKEAIDGAPMLVEADANQLQQALVNLALNAHDAQATTADPYAPLTFRLRQEILTAEVSAFPQNVLPGDYVVLEVLDHGCGMTDPVLNQALDPFFTTKEVGKGTGLGLPMVFGIVQGHQGYLTIHSSPDRGTCVALYLPRLLEPGPQSPTAAFEAGEVLEPEPQPGHAILVIDDEEAIQDVVRRFLEIAGHQVTCVGTGQEALDLLGEGRTFDLVILDLMLPREDGYVTFQRLRLRRPTLPVLVCTGLPQADGLAQVQQAGAAGILRKPFRMNELWYAVKQALGNGPAADPAP